MFLLALMSACKPDDDHDPSDTDTGGTTDPALVQLSFEAVPGNGFDIDGHVYDTSLASYADKEVFTDSVLAEVLPDLYAAVGVDDVDAFLTPGGYLLATSPSLQIQAPFAPAEVDNLAAALGWTCYQWSVLVTDYGDTDGGTGYANVALDATVDADLAQRFFEHAAGVDPGLGGGYTAFGDVMTFLNLRGSDGTPYSGLEDDAFIAALQTAASSFTDAGATVASTGEVGAKFVENDWSAATTGEDYLELVEDADEPALVPLRDAYEVLLGEAGATYGWY